MANNSFLYGNKSNSTTNRKPKFKAGADLKKSVEGKRKPKFAHGADLKNKVAK